MLRLPSRFATVILAFAPLGTRDTIERRRGKRITARGIYRDPVRSSHGHLVKASGLRWLSLMLLAPVPWAGRILAVPDGAGSPGRYGQQRGRPHKKLTDRGPAVGVADIPLAARP